jgi:tetratricopeptide (TPR) repeat protein
VSIRICAAVAVVLAAAALPAAAEPESPCAEIATAERAAQCEREISAENDASRRAQLLFTRAYAYNERERYEEALADLHAVLALVPNDPLALRERAYTLNELARYREAAADLDRHVALEPRNPLGYQERAFTRLYLGDLAGAYADRDMVVRLSPGDGGALLARADLHMWLGRFDDARNDIEAGASLAARNSNTDLQQQAAKSREALVRWTTVTPRAEPAQMCDWERMASRPTPANLIGDCTALFLAARTPAGQADALTLRSIAWRLGVDVNAGVEDLRIAAALDPDDYRRHINLGQAYLQVQHSWAARMEFDRAIALQPDAMGYSGRAAANLNLGSFEAAMRDAQASYGMRPNWEAAWVMGDIAFEHTRDHDAARRHWLTAFDLGVRDDRLMERLRRVGVEEPETAARE